MGDNNSNESLIDKYNALTALKDDVNRLERITKLLEILSIEMGTIASDKAEGFTEDVKLQLEALKPQLEALKPQLEALKDNVKAKATAAKAKATAVATTAFARASGYGSGVVSNITGRVSSFLGQKSAATGGKRIAAHAASAYKSNGDKVVLLIDNKKLHRNIYVKGNGKAKYCKINNEFILLSKLKNRIIES